MARLLNKAEETYYTYEFNDFEKRLLTCILLSVKEAYPKDEEMTYTIKNLLEVFTDGELNE
jgi:hypothetical protein